MPFLVFDPEGELDTCSIQKPKKPIIGGGLTGAQRCEYLRLCTLITSRDPSLNYAELRDQILAIMKEDVLHHIQTLPEADRPALINDIEQFYSTIDTSDNPLTCINIIGIQTSILFTQYLEDPKEKEKYHIFLVYDAYQQLTKDDSWKTYSTIKELILLVDSEDFNFLVSNPEPTEGIPSSTPIFLVFLGFVTLKELMGTILNNIVFCALSYTIAHVDGPLQHPIVALWHDIFHYSVYQECNEYPPLLNEFKNFQKFVVETQEKSTQYAVHFVLFCLLHEEPYCGRFRDLENSVNNPFFRDITPEFLLEQLELNLEDLLDLDNQGKAIPKAYREVEEENPTLLKEEKVQEYLERASQLYVKAYKEFEASKNKKGGRRSTRKRRAPRRKRNSTRALH